MLPAKSAQVYDYKEQRTRGEGGRLLVDGGGRCLNQRPEKQVPPLGLKSSVGMTIGRGANGEQRTAKSEERRSSHCRYTTLSGAEERTSSLKPACCSASRTSGVGSINATSRGNALRLYSRQNCSG